MVRVLGWAMLVTGVGATVVLARRGGPRSALAAEARTPLVFALMGMWVAGSQLSAGASGRKATAWGVGIAVGGPVFTQMLGLGHRVLRPQGYRFSKAWENAHFGAGRSAAAALSPGRVVYREFLSRWALDESTHGQPEAFIRRNWSAILACEDEAAGRSPLPPSAEPGDHA